MSAHREQWLKATMSIQWSALEPQSFVGLLTGCVIFVIFIVNIFAGFSICVILVFLVVAGIHWLNRCLTDLLIDSQPIQITVLKLATWCATPWSFPIAFATIHHLLRRAGVQSIIATVPAIFNCIAVIDMTIAMGHVLFPSLVCKVSSEQVGSTVIGIIALSAMFGSSMPMAARASEYLTQRLLNPVMVKKKMKKMMIMMMKMMMKMMKMMVEKMVKIITRALPGVFLMLVIICVVVAIVPRTISISHTARDMEEFRRQFDLNMKHQEEARAFSDLGFKEMERRRSDSVYGSTSPFMSENDYRAWYAEVFKRPEEDAQQSKLHESID